MGLRRRRRWSVCEALSVICCFCRERQLGGRWVLCRHFHHFKINVKARLDDGFSVALLIEARGFNPSALFIGMKYFGPRLWTRVPFFFFFYHMSDLMHYGSNWTEFRLRRNRSKLIETEFSDEIDNFGLDGLLLLNNSIFNIIFSK